MSWHNDCGTFDSRIEASANDANFNDTEFLLVQGDATNPDGDKVFVNKAVLALISPVFYGQFYGPLSSNQPPPIVDGTARGFKQLVKFIYNPTSFSLPVDNVVEVFEISYFAHKYQIGSLVSECRNLLGKFNVDGKELETLNWAVSTEQGQSFKKTLKPEYELLLHRCWKQIEENFKRIFPNAEIKNGQELLDEHLMVKIFSLTNLDAEETFMLLLTLDYFSKLIEKGHNSGENKKLKIDNEKEWNEKLTSIKSVIKFDKVSPKKFAEVVEKIVDKVPDSILKCITVCISSTWKDLNSLTRFSRENGKRRFEHYRGRYLKYDFNTNSEDCIHDNWLSDNQSDNIEASITFKTNQNAILTIYSASIHGMLCSDSTCGNDSVDCCVEDKVVFNNEVHSKEEFSWKRTKKYRQYKHHFYVEANKKATLRYERNCKKSSCPLHLQRIQQSHFMGDNFSVEILEVNGQPVSTPCYSFIEFLMFTPV